ncbi:MAG: sensor histidine kinase, partial [Paraclostridium sp.]
MKKLIYTIILSVFCLITSVLNIEAYNENNKKVLFISSYNPTFITFNDQIKGIQEALDEDIILQIEYMNYKTIDNSEDKQKLNDLFKSKIDNYNKFDAIILADNAALSFGVANRNTLFKDTPIVFLGVHDKELIERALELEDVYGIEENLSIKENIDFIGSVHKNKNLVAIIDYPEKESKQLKEFYKLQEKHKSLNFKHISSYGKSEQEFKKELRKLGKDDVVLVMNIYTNRIADENNIKKELKLIKDNISSPTYCLYNLGESNELFYMEDLIGGKVVSHYEQGKKSGEITQNILDGKYPTEKFVEKEDINKFIFDDKQLRMHNIPKRKLPEGSSIVSSYSNFFRDYKNIAINVVVIIVCLTLVIVAFIIYIIERLKYEKELVKDRNRAEYSNEAKSHFISNMSHELRTPLTLILSASNLLDLNASKCTMSCAGSNQNSTRIIRQNCYRLIRLTNNIIDVTKADSNFVDLRLSNVNMIYILEAIVDSTIEYAKSKNIDIIFDTDEEEIFMSVDVDKIERIVLNLVSNAIKFSNEGKTIF